MVSVVVFVFVCLFTFTKPLGLVFVGQQITFRLQGLRFHLCIFVAQLAIATRKTECLAPISLGLDQSAKTNFQAKPDV